MGLIVVTVKPGMCGDWHTMCIVETIGSAIAGTFTWGGQYLYYSGHRTECGNYEFDFVDIMNYHGAKYMFRSAFCMGLAFMFASMCNPAYTVGTMCATAWTGVIVGGILTGVSHWFSNRTPFYYGLDDVGVFRILIDCAKGEKFYEKPDKGWNNKPKEAKDNKEDSDEAAEETTKSPSVFSGIGSTVRGWWSGFKGLFSRSESADTQEEKPEVSTKVAVTTSHSLAEDELAAERRAASDRAKEMGRRRKLRKQQKKDNAAKAAEEKKKKGRDHWRSWNRESAHRRLVTLAARLPKVAETTEAEHDKTPP